MSGRQLIIWPAPSDRRRSVREVPTMVKHYLKYALSTLSAAMFAHMA
ncbi:hypothetical protein [Streptomyces sp. NRRL S-340]|nr:hypothetical protein [Streptomyces sp. NRRL S-340]